MKRSDGLKILRN